MIALLWFFLTLLASPSFCDTGDGVWLSQPPSDAGMSWPPSQGTRLDPLRPACASCIATAIFEYWRTPASTGLNAASVASSYSPRSPGVMRPFGSTAVASMHNMPAPEWARLPRWTRCQVLAFPLSSKYDEDRCVRQRGIVDISLHGSKSGPSQQRGQRHPSRRREIRKASDRESCRRPPTATQRTAAARAKADVDHLITLRMRSDRAAQA
jgi:hypothetical protein